MPGETILSNDISEATTQVNALEKKWTFLTSSIADLENRKAGLEKEISNGMQVLDDREEAGRRRIDESYKKLDERTGEVQCREFAASQKEESLKSLIDESQKLKLEISNENKTLGEKQADVRADINKNQAILDAITKTKEDAEKTHAEKEASLNSFSDLLNLKDTRLTAYSIELNQKSDNLDAREKAVLAKEVSAETLQTEALNQLKDSENKQAQATADKQLAAQILEDAKSKQAEADKNLSDSSTRKNWLDSKEKELLEMKKDLLLNQARLKKLMAENNIKSLGVDLDNVEL